MPEGFTRFRYIELPSERAAGFLERLEAIRQLGSLVPGSVADHVRIHLEKILRLVRRTDNLTPKIGGRITISASTFWGGLIIRTGSVRHGSFLQLSNPEKKKYFQRAWEKPKRTLNPERKKCREKTSSF